MSTYRKIARLRALHVSRSGEEFEHWMSACESPIERLFLAHGMLETDRDWRVAGYEDFKAAQAAMRAGGWAWRSDASEYAARLLRVDFPALAHALAVQLPVRLEGQICRIDVAVLSLVSRLRVAIELDGHDFHERTREQAARDKKRDRALTAAGWRVLRFTGSEVYRDVAACWVEVEDVIEAWECP